MRITVEMRNLSLAAPCLCSGRRRYLESIWVGKVDGSGKGHGDPHVHHLGGHVAEREVTDQHLHAVGEVHQGGRRVGRPCQLHVHKREESSGYF